MGITFAYELGLKSFLYEKSSTQKVTSEFKKPNRKEDTGRLRSGQGKKFKKNQKLIGGAFCIFAKCATHKDLPAFKIQIQPY